MGLDLPDDTSGAEATVEREDPVAAHERKKAEVDEARKARSERLGHEVFTEKVEKAAKKKVETEPAAEAPSE
jgi:hypothetical protein